MEHMETMEETPGFSMPSMISMVNR